jgi:hypothetical protein
VLASSLVCSVRLRGGLLPLVLLSAQLNLFLFLLLIIYFWLLEGFLLAGMFSNVTETVFNAESQFPQHTCMSDLAPTLSRGSF